MFRSLKVVRCERDASKKNCIIVYYLITVYCCDVFFFYFFFQSSIFRKIPYYTRVHALYS